ncbi:diacylglycerol/lipid kinase family protein [Deinococcus peraridilitoris]|uniref:Sphingosine/diacylglycerol kinase-like enzyme n=1 Tax=Deinococcus peraridilitoris (strain DSM 19664 / LMG 22246 / CIP 109416 / KR-200) TaxID=937777 RepID=L0A1S0_DEIPD|nr:diacylglycerol kinase family protein [Deinococcus peraridilitoris]AFZ66965.1 sphingosine/diacylglycerol kinase-like enzyme [Deinococcus peraridilitoris DSM 19664]
MQATLVYNPMAGGASRVQPEELQRALTEAGFHPVYQETTTEADLDEVLDNARDLVVAVGGDGTVRAVAKRLIRRSLRGEGVPLAILPLGTANNIARTLDLSGTPLELAARLKAGEQRAFDVGKITAPWGEEFFLEAAGCGLYAEVLAAYDPEEGKSVSRALSTLGNTLSTYVPLDLQLVLDGQLLSGSFLLAEMLNTCATGPRLKLAPAASTEDGLLDLVLVSAEDRDHTLQYLRCLVTGELHTLPSVRTLQGRHLRVTWKGQAVHVDGEVRPVRGHEELPPVLTEEGTLDIEVLPGALTLLLPASEVCPPEARAEGQPTSSREEAAFPREVSA